MLAVIEHQDSRLPRRNSSRVSTPTVHRSAATRGRHHRVGYAVGVVYPGQLDQPRPVPILGKPPRPRPLNATPFFPTPPTAREAHQPPLMQNLGATGPSAPPQIGCNERRPPATRQVPPATRPEPPKRWGRSGQPRGSKLEDLLSVKRSCSRCSPNSTRPSSLSNQHPGRAPRPPTTQAPGRRDPPPSAAPPASAPH